MDYSGTGYLQGDGEMDYSGTGYTYREMVGVERILKCLPSPAN